MRATTTVLLIALLHRGLASFLSSTGLGHVAASSFAHRGKAGHHGVVSARPCPDTSSCPPIGQNVSLFLIEGGKEDAAFANQFYTTVANGVLYAWHHGMVPWVRFDPERVYRTFGKAWTVANNGSGQLWEQLFESYCPGLEAWRSACPNVFVAPRKSVKWWYDYVGQHAMWAVHSWYNYGSPAVNDCLAARRLPEDGPFVSPVCAAGSQPWRPCPSGGWDKECTTGKCTCDLFNDTLYALWRGNGAAVVSHAHRLRPAVKAAVDQAWLALNVGGATPVLGCHMRGTDKASGRRRVKPSAFEAYVADFFETFPSGRVFVATESSEYAAVVRGAWRARWGAQRVLMRDIGTRVSGKRLNAMVYVDRQLDVLQDVFFDIQLMARCDYLLHSASAVSEAVIYSNLALHTASVHLEYQHDTSNSGRRRDAPWRRPPPMQRAPDGRRQYPPTSTSAVQ